jgi:alkane 1-monooxygenase
MAGYPTSTAPSGTVPEGSTDTWSDKKRYLWLIGLVVPSLAFLAILGYASTGWGVWLWLGPIIILGVVPAIDLMTGLDRSNPPDDVIEALESDRYYRWVTYFFLPIQYAGFIGAMVIAAGHNPVAWVIDLVGLTDFAAANLPALFTGDLALSTIDKVALAISIGCIGGIGINTAHELGH